MKFEKDLLHTTLIYTENPECNCLSYRLQKGDNLKRIVKLLTADKICYEYTESDFNLQSY